MCIIAIKNKNVAMPTEETFKNMFTNNPDGAGFMYNDGKRVHIIKGLMSFKDFKKALEKVERQIDTTNAGMIFHFRIGTHGGNVPENTHPFPISDKIKDLQSTHMTTSLGVAHNGIIHVTPRVKNISDTMEYIISQLAPLRRAVPEFYKNEDLILLIKNGIKSKMAFLTPTGAIYTIGDFVKDGEMIYSNTSYKPYDIRKFSYSAYNWDWEDDGYYLNHGGKTSASGVKTYTSDSALSGYGKTGTYGSSYWSSGNTGSYWSNYNNAKANATSDTAGTSTTSKNLPSFITEKRVLSPVNGDMYIVTKDGYIDPCCCTEMSFDSNGKLWICDPNTQIFYPIEGKCLYKEVNTPVLSYWYDIDEKYEETICADSAIGNHLLDTEAIFIDPEDWEEYLDAYWRYEDYADETVVTDDGDDDLTNLPSLPSDKRK